MNKTIKNVADKLDAKLWKEKPVICVAIGVIGVGFSTYLTWKASRKHDETMESIKNDIAEVRETKPEDVDDSEASAEAISEHEAQIVEYRKELRKVYVKSGFKLVKLYGAAATIEAASIASILTGFGIMKQRNSACVAACAVAEKGFREYRKRVVDELGEDVDKEFRYGLKETSVEVPDLDKNGEQKLDKEGKPKTKKQRKVIMEEDLDEFSTYARIFKPGFTTQAEEDKETGLPDYAYNLKFVKDQEDYFNKIIKYRPNHIVFLNEVYKALGFEPTKAGQIVGWVYDSENPDNEDPISFDICKLDDVGTFVIDFNDPRNVLDYL